MPAKPSRDHRPSLRLLVAAARLRDGEPVEQVAEQMRLPVALVALIADELRNRNEPRS